MKRFILTTSIALALALGLTLALLWVLGQPPAARADPGTLYVAPDGDDGKYCGSVADRCRTVQRAVDRAQEGDEILVATGTYTGVQAREGMTQVIYISETVTIRGGYNTAFTTWDPDTYSTTLDAQRQARVVYVRGEPSAHIAPTLEGLRLTGGVADVGGGVHSRDADPVISGCHVFSNTATNDGGGLLLGGRATLAGNRIYGNTATDDGGGASVGGDGATLTGNRIYRNEAAGGGGLCLSFVSNATLTDNDIYANTATDDGGGVFSSNSPNPTMTGNRVYSNTANIGGGIYMSGGHDGILTDNQVYNNTASLYAGGLYLYFCNRATLIANQVYSNTSTGSDSGGLRLAGSQDVTLTANLFYSNTAKTNGGGLYLHNADNATLTANWIYGNAARNGGGLYFYHTTDATLVNNAVVENRSTSGGEGAGVRVFASDVRLLHTTIARNTGGDGSGVHVDNHSTDYSSAALTNTILVSQTIGIYVVSNNTTTLEATLWGGGAWANGDDWDGFGQVVTSTDLYGNPAFADADSGDYHITFGSAARDAGVAAGASEDIDGDSRLFDAQPDIGADEYACHVRLDSTPYPTVQAALDAATDSDVVQVAGTCRGVQTRASNQQLAYVTETLTIRGGYSADFTDWNPITYPTTLDAQGQGRVVYLYGQPASHIDPTLEGLRLTGGSATTGAGISGSWADPVISDCLVYNNAASISGGGVRLGSCDAATMVGNTIRDNTASNSGGGVYLANCNNATLTANAVYSNAAKFSGGVYIQDSSDAVLVNNMVAENHLTSAWGAGLRIRGSSARLLHTTIARNSGGSGEGVYVSHGAAVWMTNTILVRHTVGIAATAGSTAMLEATLWGDGPWANDLDWDGAGYITRTSNVTGTPNFVDPDGGDYHIGLGSAAIDAGLDTDVTIDIDGETRTDGPDLGADEFIARYVYLPLVLKD
jgi:parallel beta-helix repeat protein